MPYVLVNFLQSDVLSKYADMIPDIAYSNDTEKYKRNLLKIEVFFDDFNYENIEEIEAYKVQRQLVSL